MGGGGVILGVETAVEHVGVAVGDGRGVRAHASLASDRRHAESLAPMIEFVLAQAGLTTADLSAVAVDAGPGLFTGMRVGIATAEALGWALEIPVVGVCSLDVLAMRAAWSDVVVATALDARRGEVYWALHRTDGTGAVPSRLSDPVVSAPEDLAVHLADRAEDVVCVGTGFLRHEEVFSAPWMRVLGVDDASPRASDVVALGARMLAAASTVGARVEPRYLRAPDAEINWPTREVAR